MEPDGDPTNRDRHRLLARLIELAKAYGGLTRTGLARSLGREPTSTLVAPSGIPKLDLAVELARVLDWPLDAIAGFLGIEPGPSPPEPPEPQEPQDDGAADTADYETLQSDSRAAQRDGRYARAVALARAAQRAAGTAEERAQAFSREAAAWEGLGVYRRVLDAVHRGLTEQPISGGLRRMLESNLANGCCMLGRLTEARGIATDLVVEFDREPPRGKRDRVTQAYVLYVRGEVWRRKIDEDPSRRAGHARRAIADLDRAIELLECIERDFDDPVYGAIANTCRGAVLEAQVALGRRKAASVLARMWAPLAGALSQEPPLQGDWLESYGWWCVFACNIARRSIQDERALHAELDRFTGVGREITRRRESWALREGIFRVQAETHRRLREWTGRSLPLVVDPQEWRALIGVVGRFPAFREIGWKLLDEASVVDSSG